MTDLVKRFGMNNSEFLQKLKELSGGRGMLGAAADRIEELELKLTNAEMGDQALEAIQQLLDSGDIPRGTFADDQVRNLVAMYNQRGERIKELEAITASQDHK